MRRCRCLVSIYLVQHQPVRIVDLATDFPVKGTMRMEMSMKADSGAGAQIEIDMAMDTTIEPTDPPAEKEPKK